MQIHPCRDRFCFSILMSTSVYLRSYYIISMSTFIYLCNDRFCFAVLMSTLVAMCLYLRSYYNIVLWTIQGFGVGFKLFLGLLIKTSNFCFLSMLNSDNFWANGLNSDWLRKIRPEWQQWLSFRSILLLECILNPILWYA